jgi:hypothetical protein
MKVPKELTEQEHLAGLRLDILTVDGMTFSF